MKLPLLIAAPLYALDQLTKWLVIRNIEFESGWTIIPGFFDLVHYGNTGAAFSILSNNNGFFIVLSVVTLIALFIFAKRGAFQGRWMQIALGLLISGILGNVTDRILHGHVVDFLLFDLHVPFANPWPAFNVADSAICVAACIFFGLSFRKEPS
jgi:signal peptidase II